LKLIALPHLQHKVMAALQFFAGDFLQIVLGYLNRHLEIVQLGSSQNKNLDIIDWFNCIDVSFSL
jgi:hypothetical protein